MKKTILTAVSMLALSANLTTAQVKLQPDQIDNVLKAKTRELKPGQSETLTMTVNNYDLASYNEATQSWEAAAGKYTLGFAANVEDIRTTAVYSLSKQQTTRCHDVMKPNMEL